MIETGQIYAMKILKKEMVVKRKQYDHTLSERRILESMNHPFIVSLRFAFQTEHKLYMVFGASACSGRFARGWLGRVVNGPLGRSCVPQTFSTAASCTTTSPRAVASLRSVHASTAPRSRSVWSTCTCAVSCIGT